MRKQIQKWTVIIFKELPLHEKRWHTFSSLSFTTLPQTPHPLAKLFTNPSTNIELFLAFTQAIHLPHHWFCSKPVSSMWHLRNISDKNLMQGLACLIYHWVLGTKHSSLYLRICLKITTDYRNAEEPEIKLPTSAGSWKKQESSRKTSISALLTMTKPLTVWITINCGKFFNRWEYQTTWSASWEICMQVRKQQLELDMEQQTGSK